MGVGVDMELSAVVEKARIIHWLDRHLPSNIWITANQYTFSELMVLAHSSILTNEYRSNFRRIETIENGANRSDSTSK